MWSKFSQSFGCAWVSQMIASWNQKIDMLHFVIYMCVISEHSEVDLSVPTPHSDDAMDPDDDPDEEDEFDED